MSKTSDKLAAGVRKVKRDPPAPQAAHAPQPAPAHGPRPAGGESHDLPAPTEGRHPARIWPD